MSAIAASAAPRARAAAGGAARPARVRVRRAAAATAAAGALAAAGFLGLRATTAFEVADVRVRGVDGPAARAVRDEAHRLVGERSLLAVDPSALERGLEALPTVRDATVDRAFPHTLAVRVVPEQAAAVLVSGDAALVVSRSGRVIDRRAAGERPRGLPLLAAPDLNTRPGQRLADPTVLAELDVVNALPADFGVRFASVRAGADGLEARTLRRGVTVLLGDTTDLRTKLIAVRAVLAAAPEARVVDVTVPTLPAVTGAEPDPATPAAAAVSGGAADGRPVDPAAVVADLFVAARR